MVLFFLKNQGERGRKGIFFNFPFFSEEPNSPFLACVSMVMVPRTVWRCSKFGSWNYQEGSVASATPSCQSFTINRSLSCILWRWSHLEWIRVFKGEPQCISPYARTESINTSRTQKQTCWCNCLALRLFTELPNESSTAIFWLKNQAKKKKKRKNEKQPLNTKAPRGRDTPDTMYSDIVVFFFHSFPNNCTHLCSITKPFFYRCLENGGMWFFQPFLYRFQAHRSIYRNTLEVQGSLFQPCWRTRSFFWSTKERL